MRVNSNPCLLTNKCDKIYSNYTDCQEIIAQAIYICTLENLSVDQLAFYVLADIIQRLISNVETLNNFIPRRTATPVTPTPFPDLVITVIGYPSRLTNRAFPKSPWSGGGGGVACEIRYVAYYS